MKILKNGLLILGLFFVVSTLIFAVQGTSQNVEPSNNLIDSVEVNSEKRVAQGYRIS
ncbi:hypothetical protein LCGC14_2881120, partial [marine sediment metagenome]